MLSWISQESASTRVPGSHTDRPLRPNRRTELRLRVSTERDRRSTAFSGMSWMSHPARVRTASVSSVTPSAVVRCTEQSVRRAAARAAICTPAPLTSYTSQPRASRPEPSPVTAMPAPVEWWMRQRSRRGRPPPRTEKPVCPEATTSHSSNTPPPPSSTAMPTPAGFSTVQRRTSGRAPGPRTSMPAAEWVLTRRSVSSGEPSSTSSAGAARSWPSRYRSCTTAEARRVSATPSRGAIRTEPDPSSGPRRVTAWCRTRFSR